MNGFFTAVKKVSKKAVPAKKVTHSCMDCPLREQDCSKNEAVVNGNGRKILILTGTTNIQTRNFERLESELSRVGISLENDCFWTSVIQSIHPYHKVMLKNGESKEQKDSHRYLECCRPKIHRLIFKHRPLAILALGDFAITSLVADRSNFRNKFGSIDNWEGACIPDRKFGSWIIPTWSIPALVQAEEGKDKNGKVYLRHFRRSLSMLAQVVKKGVYPEVGNDEDCVEVILDDNKAIERMKQCKEYFKKYPDDVLSFDYETTGLKPYLPKQKIICVSLAWKTNHALAFELNDRTWPEFESILFDKNIRKCAHNIAFEHLWTLVKSPSHKGVEGWGQDTQLDAHILDNRTGNAGLKKQTYLNFGIAGYDDEVDGYLEADYPNDINRIRELPIATVLKYCALDSLYGLRLAKKQDKEFAKKARVNPKILEARKLFLEGAVTLSEMGAVGFKIDKGILRTNKQEIQKKIADLYDEIMQDPDVVRWKKRMGSEFNLNSNDQLSDTLFNQMKLPKPDKVTASGKIATDSKTLSDYEVPFLEKKSEIKKLEKLMGTYVDAVEREAPDGFLHCFFSLNGPRTFRSSSSDINIGLPCLDVVKLRELREPL